MPRTDTTTCVERVQVYEAGRDEPPSGVALRASRGGLRYVCPVCYRKATRLFRVLHRVRSRRECRKRAWADAAALACRRCHGLRYAVQYDTAEDRQGARLLGVSASTVRALRRRLEGRGDVWRDDE